MTMLRRTRIAAGWSQAELAARAGVSRQLIGAAEAGRHQPRVDAALAIAAALGVPVERIFGDAAGPSPVDGLHGTAPADGTLVRTALVRDQLITGACRAGQDGWDVADAVIEGGEVRQLGTMSPGPVVAGCEPGLELLERLLREGGIGAVSLACGNAAALAALAAGRVHAAVVHVPEDAPAPDAGTEVVRYAVARWTVGLVAPERAPAGWWAQALAGRVPVVQREPGAGVQRTFEDARTAPGPAPGPRVGGHLEAARTAIATGMAAVTIEPAALSVGGRFHPLAVHEAQLWVAADLRAEPAVEAALQVVAGRRFQSRLAHVGGYDLAGCGDRVA